MDRLGALTGTRNMRFHFYIIKTVSCGLDANSVVAILVAPATLQLQILMRITRICNRIVGSGLTVLVWGGSAREQRNLW